MLSWKRTRERTHRTKASIRSCRLEMSTDPVPSESALRLARGMEMVRFSEAVGDAADGRASAEIMKATVNIVGEENESRGLHAV